jgi:hypothetical protein
MFEQVDKEYYRKKVVQLGRHSKLDPVVMMHDVADEAHDYDYVVVVAKKKDDAFVTWANFNKAPWLIFGFAQLLIDMAMESFNGPR